MPKIRLAAGGVGSLVNRATCAQMQRVGPQLIQPEPPERDQQVITPHAPEAGQREPLEHTLEASLRRPLGLAGEGALLRASVLGKAPVGDQGLPAAAGVVGAARSERDLARGRALCLTPNC